MIKNKIPRIIPADGRGFVFILDISKRICLPEKRIKAEIKRQQAGIDRLYQAVADGYIGGDDATDFINRKKSELAQLKEALEEEEKPMPKSASLI